MLPHTELVPVDKIRSNPYRDLKRNPIDSEKAEAIAVSISKNTFWLGIYGRRMEDGTVQLAFGHTRLESAKMEGLKEIPVTLADLSDGQMLVYLASENVRGEQAVVQEAVFAAVKALADKKIELGPLDEKVPKAFIRYAPSFIPGSCAAEGRVPYTSDMLARFLGYVKRSTGRPKNSFTAALGVLELEERNLLTNLSTIKDLNERQVLQMVSDIKQREVKTKDRAEAQRKAEAEVLAEKLKLEEEQKEAQKKAQQEYEASLKKETEARKEEDKKELERIRKARKEKETEAKAKEKADVAKKKVLDQKLAQIKQEAARAEKESEYAPIRRQVETLLFKLESEPSWSEESKTLSRKALTAEDRERVRQAALKRGVWYSETLSNLFLPPLSQTKAIAEYRGREEGKRRTEENKKEKKK
jgi:hypothetical protein